MATFDCGCGKIDTGSGTWLLAVVEEDGDTPSMIGSLALLDIPFIFSTFAFFFCF